jgi:RNA polymerase sigma-54 factor
MASIEQRRHQSTVQTQHQKISQKQIQAVSFLSMSNEDLKQEISNFVQENPFIKVQYRKKNKNFASSDAFQAIIENQETYTESLQSHLLHQINSMPLTPTELEISQRLIYNLDQNGCYGSMLAPESLLDFNNPNHTKKLLNKCIKIIQRLDPIGTCCKTLEESLWFKQSSKKILHLWHFLF